MIRNLINNIKHTGNRARILSKSFRPVFCGSASVKLIHGSKSLTHQQLYDFSDQPQKPPEGSINFDQLIPNLLTVPMAAQRFDSSLFTEEELKMPEQLYYLFSSNQPIFPNIKYKIKRKNNLIQGNLKDISRPMLYCISSSEKGEIYTVGVALSKNVEQQLGKKIKSQNLDTFNNTQYQMEVRTKKNNCRIKLTEIIMNNEGIFAKGIPYLDRPLTKNENEFNVQNILRSIYESLQDIIKISKHDKIDIAKDLDLSFFDRLDEVKQDEIDSMVYQIAFNFQNNMNLYMKENSSRFVQRLLESRTYIDRVIILQQQMQTFQETMNIVDRNLKQAESQMAKLQMQQMARLATEYIRQQYFREAQTPPPGSTTSFGGGQSYQYQQERPAGSPLVKKYYDKLPLIEDVASREKIRKEIERFASMDKHSSEYSKIVTYLDEVFSVPWNQFTPVEWDSEYAAKVLDEEIYGLEKVKQRIIEMIAVNKLRNSDEKSKGFVLLLNGPPGTGKTSIAKTIAKCLKRTSRFISFAGVADSHFFKGHRRTYVDSQPGVFVKELIKANTMNPVFILDEVDKISKSNAGSDPYYSLLEILNSEENHNFLDHYLDISTDFSKVIFILTSNSLLTMLEPLQNRLEIIEVSAYIEEEKLAIGKNYIIPKVLEANGIQQGMVIFNDETIQKVIKGWCYYESGVRELKRQFEKIARKYATEIVAFSPPSIVQTDEQTQINEKTEPEQQQSKQSISFIDQKSIQKLDLTKDQNLELLQKYLGPPVFDAYAEQRNQKIFPVGQVNILTVAGLVGNVLVVECCFDNSEWEKKGQLTSSGNLKNVLQESLKLAKINAVKYLNEDQIKLIQKNNVHIHFMSGAVPKDGPSAGTAITTAIISLATGIQISSTVSMTGEISLNGNVSKIGGVQQKLIASKTLGINDVILPKTNLSDVLELSQQLMNGMTLYFVDKYDQIYSLIFEEGLEQYKSQKKLKDNIIVVKDGVIVTDVGDSIYSRYSINAQQIQGAVQDNLEDKKK